MQHDEIEIQETIDVLKKNECFRRNTLLSLPRISCMKCKSSVYIDKEKGKFSEQNVCYNISDLCIQKQQDSSNVDNKLLRFLRILEEICPKCGCRREEHIDWILSPEMQSKQGHMFKRLQFEISEKKELLEDCKAKVHQLEHEMKQLLSDLNNLESNFKKEGYHTLQ